MGVIEREIHECAAIFHSTHQEDVPAPSVDLAVSQQNAGDIGPARGDEWKAVLGSADDTEFFARRRFANVA